MIKYIDMFGYGEGSVEKMPRFFWEKYSLNVIGDGYFHNSGVRIHIIEFAPFEWVVLDNAVCIADWYFDEVFGGFDAEV